MFTSMAIPMRLTPLQNTTRSCKCSTGSDSPMTIRKIASSTIPSTHSPMCIPFLRLILLTWQKTMPIAIPTMGECILAFVASRNLKLLWKNRYYVYVNTFILATQTGSIILLVAVVGNHSLFKYNSTAPANQ